MPSTEAQRRAASKGWVVSTLDPDALTAGAELQSGLAIEVRHRDELGAEVIVPRAGPAPTGDDLVTSVDTQGGWPIEVAIGRAQVCTPVTNAHIVCSLLHENKKNNQ